MTGIFIFSGDIVYLNVLGQPIVILNSKEAITDLLDVRGGIYSDRPTLAVLRNWLVPYVLFFSIFATLSYSNKGWYVLGPPGSSLRRGNAYPAGSPLYKNIVVDNRVLIPLIDIANAKPRPQTNSITRI